MRAAATHEPSGWLAGRTRFFLAVAVVAVYATRLAASAGELLQGDGWFCLLLGREIADHGLPHEDTLTALGSGRSWIDVQWLAHSIWHALREIGGARLVLVSHVLLLCGALVLAFDAARRAGASSRRVALAGLVALLVLMPQRLVRAQSFGVLCLVLVLWIAIVDARRGRRTLAWTLPVLVLWANLHGSVLVGVGLAGLAALVSASRRTGRARLERLGLGVAIAVTPFATPYSPGELLAYWSKMAGDPGPFTEWDAPTFGTAPVHVVLAVATLALLVWRARKVDLLHGVLLGACAILSLTGLRYGLLLGYAFAVFGPSLLDVVLPGPGHDPSVRAWPLALAASLAFLAGLTHGMQHVPSTVGWRYPRAVLAAELRGGLVFSSESHGDWLLDQRPDLRGRVLFGVRSELGSAQEWSAVQDVLGGNLFGLDALGRDLGQPIRHVVVDREEWGATEHALEEAGGWTRVLRRDGVAVYSRE
ncbi:MAG: hypothetical protein H6722_06545 [Sandaracinus sp.]|nr:hypothetical protein [Sandaracinus sp.]